MRHTPDCSFNRSIFSIQLEAYNEDQAVIVVNLVSRTKAENHGSTWMMNESISMILTLFSQNTSFYKALLHVICPAL